MGNTASGRIAESVELWAQPVPEDEEHSEKVEEYRRYILLKWVFMAGCAAASVLVMGVALTIGEYSISFSDSYRTLWAHLTGNVTDKIADYVIWDLRLPRVLTGVLVGAGLATGGAAMQSSLKNPLADPYTTGISSGAGLGATLAICSGLTLMGGYYATVMNAFVFSLVPVTVILLVSKMKGGSPTVMIMAGIAVMYIFNAISTVLKLWAEAEKLMEVFSWSVGSLDRTSWENVWVIAVFTIAGIIAVQFLSRRLNVMAAGDESAKAMGVDAETLRILVLAVVSLMVAAIVSFTGLIGFVGLVCPHIVRIFIGSDNRYLVPASALFGAALLLSADVIGRVIIAPATLQVGVVTAFIGGPMFLYLIIRERKSAW